MSLHDDRRRAFLVNEAAYQASRAAGTESPFPRRVTTALALRSGGVLLPTEVPDDATIEHSMSDMYRSAMGYALVFQEPFLWEDAAGAPQQLLVQLGWLDDASMYPRHRARLIEQGMRGAA